MGTRTEASRIELYDDYIKRFNPSDMWNYKNTYAIGGLENVGFVDGQDFLLVLSSQGEGMFDCLTGQRTARNSNGYGWSERFNDETMTITGFDSFTGTKIQTSGLHGSYKLRKESDGWLLSNAGDDIFLISPDKNETLVSNVGICELRAFGFSDTGRSFIIASSCDVVFYSKI